MSDSPRIPIRFAVFAETDKTSTMYSVREFGDMCLLLSAWDIQKNRALLNSYPEEYSGMFSAIAVNEYNPVNPDNDYMVSNCIVMELM